MKYLTKRLITFYTAKPALAVLFISMLLSYPALLKAQAMTQANFSSSATSATSPSAINTEISATGTPNSFTLIFHKPYFYPSIAIAIALCIILLIFIRRTVLSKQQIETVNFKLKRKHCQFKFLFDNTPDAMILIKDSLYADVNSATLKLFGYSDKKQLINIKIGTFSPTMQPDGMPSIEKINHHFDKCEKEGSSRFEWQYQKTSGQILWLEIAITKMVFSKETLIHMVCRDIDDIKKLEYQNTLKTMQLENSNRELIATIDNLNQAQDKFVATEKMAALGALVAGISHEIKRM